MVSEHNVRQPMEAIGVMDRVEVVSILQKNSPLAGISGSGSTISVSLVHINAFM
jgi:hypothetical protein